MSDPNNGLPANPQHTETGFIPNEENVDGFSPDKVNVLASEKSEDTIRRVLSGYELGRKIRQLRLRKKIGLVDLGKHTGLSASMLSQLENGKLIPTLPTLARIAMVFDVGVDQFFADRKKRRLFAITRATDRIRFPERPDAPDPNFFFECLAYSAQDKSIQAYLADFPEHDPKHLTEHFHDGAEFLFIVAGTLEVTYQEEIHELHPGDCVYFDSVRTPQLPRNVPRSRPRRRHHYTTPPLMPSLVIQ